MRPVRVKLSGISILLSIISLSASPLDVRTFNTPNSLWFVSGESIRYYSIETRLLRSITLDQSVAEELIDDVAVSENTMYLAAGSGIYSLDMNTASKEIISTSKDKDQKIRIGADYDYVWIAQGSELLQFDKMSREWMSFIRENTAPVLHIQSTEDLVYLLSKTGIEVFSPTDERWRSYPLQGGGLSEGRIFIRLTASGLLAADGEKLLFFSFENTSWQRIELNAPIIDFIAGDPVAFCLTHQGVLSINTRTSVITRLNIPGLQSATTLAYSERDTMLYITTERSITAFNTSTSRTSTIEYSPSAASSGIIFSSASDSLLAIKYPGILTVRNGKTSLWENIPVRDRTRGGAAASWDDEGLSIRYTGPFSSKLHGFTEWSKKIVNDTIFIDTVPWGNAIPNKADLLLHTTLGNQRHLDMHFNNTRIGVVPEKGINYIGNNEDILRQAHAGTNRLAVVESKIIQSVNIEGVSADFQSKERVEGRDRRIVRASTSAGYIVSQTRRELLAYRSGRNYPLAALTSDTSTVDTLQILPGTVRVTVDGEHLDTSRYRIFYTTGTLQFTSESEIDPTSIIIVSYQVRTVSKDGPGTVEFIPESRFGSVGHLDLMVTPRHWLSPRLGYTYLNTDQRHDLLSAGLPLEFRKDQLMLRINPEYAFDTRNPNGARSGSLSLNSRIGKKLGIEFEGFLADSAFTSTNELSYGYGNRLWDLEQKISYDFHEAVPASYYQHHRTATGGNENRYELNAGLRFPKLPYLDMTLSRNRMDASIEAVMRDTTEEANDSIFIKNIDNVKDRMRLRLYESSSVWLPQLMRIAKASYDLSYTEFSSQSSESTELHRGRIVTGDAVFFPITSLSISPYGTYQVNPGGMRIARELRPSLAIQGIDLPRGVDFLVDYSIDLGRLAETDSSTLLITRSIDLALKPGIWWKSLQMLTLRSAVKQQLFCPVWDNDLTLWATLVGSESVAGRSLTTSAGFDLYPMPQILFTNNNTHTKTDTLTLITTNNDLQLRLTNKDLVHTQFNAEYSRHKGTRYFGFSRYEKTLTSWLTIHQGISGTHFSHLLSYTRMGPEFGIDIYARDLLFLKLLQMKHTLGKLEWTRTGGAIDWSSPEISYSMNLRAVFKPNISFEMNHLLGIKGKGTVTEPTTTTPAEVKEENVGYTADVKLQLIF